VSGLEPGTRYALAVRSVTDGGGGNPNRVTSEASPEIEALTTSTPAPKVVLTRFPEVLTFRADGADSDSTTLSIANVGNAPSDITLLPTGDFFTLSDTLVRLEGGASATVTIAGHPRSEVAELRGTVSLSGQGVPADLTVEVKAFAAPPPPSGEPRVIVETSRVDVSAPAGQNPTGSVTFRNVGTGRATGVLGADQPWIVPEPSVKIIEAGSTGTFGFTIDRAKRPDAGAPAGSQQGNLLFVYVAGAGSGSGRSPFGTSPTLSAPIRISDTVKPADKGACPGTCVNGVPLLGDGEIGLVVSGLGSIVRDGNELVSDLTIGNRSVVPITDFSLYFAGKAVGQTVPARASLSLADVATTAFGAAGQLGALHLRSPAALNVALTARSFSRSGSAGTLGFALPVFRTDRGAAAGVTIVLPGVRHDATSLTRMFVQEVRGADSTVRIDFLDATGALAGSVTGREVPAFGLTVIDESSIPQGVVTARITNSGSGAIVAYATVVDRAGKDSWVVADWGQVYDFSPTDAHVLAVAASAPGRNDTYFHSSLAIHGLGSGSATLRYYPLTPKVAPVEKVVTLVAGETKGYEDVVAGLFETSLPSIGYVEITPAPGVRVKSVSRSYTTRSGSGATFGAGVPMHPEESALRVGQSIVFGGLEDSTLETIRMGVPATFRTNVGLAEVGGAAVKVRVSILLYDGTELASGGATAARDYDLAPREWSQLNGIVDEIVGRELRSGSIGELSNVQVRVQVVGGEGAVLAYVSQTDNASGDTVIRFE
jgi:hypothetical protein